MVTVLKESNDALQLKLQTTVAFEIAEPYSEESNVSYEMLQSNNWSADLADMTEWFRGVGTQLLKPANLSIVKCYLSDAELTDESDPYSGSLSVISIIRSNTPISEDDYSYLSEAVIEYAEYDIAKAIQYKVSGKAYSRDQGYAPNAIEPTYSYYEVDEIESGIEINTSNIKTAVLKA